MWRRALLCLGLVGLLLGPAAIAQETQLVSVLTVHVQPGHQQAYEAGLKDLWKAFKKAGADRPIFVSSGLNDLGTYNFAVLFSSWGDFDAWNEKIQSAYAAAPDVMQSLQQTSSHFDFQMWTALPDQSYTPATPRLQDSEIGYTRVAFLYPHPAKAQAVQEAMKEAVAMRKKHGLPDATRAYALAMGADGPAIAVLIDAKDEADFAMQNAKAQEKLGAEWDAYVAKVGPMLRNVEFRASAPRPDLAYQP